jgi:hypothetical protein
MKAVVIDLFADCASSASLEAIVASSDIVAAITSVAALFKTEEDG